ncbi:MAG: phosphoribosylamine--glycine ligase [Pseudomonadota bacterium]
MRVLVVGGGGREHALAWKASQSPLVSQVYVAPGNAGTDSEPGISNIAIAADDIDALAVFAVENEIGLTIVGPEAPLVAGITDVFERRGLRCFGPSAAAAQLEGSKTFSKEFLDRHSIPTAKFGSFVDSQKALEFCKSLDLPIVIKADGLAAGKGVVIADDWSSVESAIDDMLKANRFGDAGSKVVVEEFLTGEEASFIVMVDGEHILPMASSQDHKAAYDGDTGPNTGGMGAYSPAPVVDSAMHAKIMQTVMQPTVAAMAEEGAPYRGFLYAGVMISDKGIPNVLEFNCRFGDPETQPILMRLESDLVAHVVAAMDGNLDSEEARWSDDSALGVVMAAKGYPDQYAKGDEIEGLSGVSGITDTKVFHAGTLAMSGEPGDKVVTSGGRVLCVTAVAASVSEAAEKAYRAVSSIHWDGCWVRNDIGHRAIKRDSDTREDR